MIINQVTLPSTKEGLRFDWHAPLKEDFITNLADRVLKQIQLSQSSRGITKEAAKLRQMSQTTIARHLLSALYNAHTVINSKATPIPVAVPKDSNLYSEKKTHVLNVPYSFRHFESVYKALVALTWIKVIKGKQGVAYTRIYASGTLTTTFDNLGLQWFKQTPNPKEALIILRDRIPLSIFPHKPCSKEKYTKITLETPETPETLQMADNLYRYNEFLIKHCVAFDLPDSALSTIAKAMAGDEDKYKHKYLDFSRVQLRRVFSRGDMSLHGRFYGGWWQSIPSKNKHYRTHITIDGHRTSEVDFSSVCLRIVYARKGISIDPKEDLYDIGLPEKQGAPGQRRQLVKTYINAIMNDEEETFRLEKEELRQLGLTHENLHSLVLKRHDPIKKELIAGIGLKTQFIDSRIAETIMLTMMNLGVLVLPIHDSFIVKDTHQKLLENIMLESFKKITGHPGSVDTTLPRLPMYFGYSEEDYSKVPEHLKIQPNVTLVGSGGSGGSGGSKLIHHKATKMSLYLNSWRRNQDNYSLSYPWNLNQSPKVPKVSWLA